MTILFVDLIYNRKSQSRQFIWCVFFVYIFIFIYNFILRRSQSLPISRRVRYADETQAPLYAVMVMRCFPHIPINHLAHHASNIRMMCILNIYPQSRCWAPSCWELKRIRHASRSICLFVAFRHASLEYVLWRPRAHGGLYDVRAVGCSLNVIRTVISLGAS